MKTDKTVNIAFIQIVDPKSNIYNYPSAGIAQLQGFLKSQDYAFTNIPFVDKIFSSPDLFDFFYGDSSNLSFDSVYDSIFDGVSLSDFDFLCLGYNYSSTVTRFNDFISFLKKKKNSIIIIAGGMLIDSSQNLLENGVIDYVVHGSDSPLRLKNIFDAENFNEIKDLPGLIYFDKNTCELVLNECNDKEFLFSSYYSLNDVLTRKTFSFNSSKHDHLKTPFAESDLLFLRSVGCDNLCFYCCLNSHRVLSKSVDAAINEIKEIIKETGTKYFFLLDNNIGNNVEESLKFCDSIIEQGLDIYWSASIEANESLSEKYFRKLKSAGCVRLYFGIDTASPRLMKLYNRKTSLDAISSSIINSSSAGITTCGLIIVGLPGETDELFQETLDFCTSISSYVDGWYISEFFLGDKSPMFKIPQRFDLKIGSVRSKTTFFDEHYDYTVSGMNFDEHEKLKSDRRCVFENIFPADVPFSFAAMEYFGSKDKMNELLEYSSKFRILSVGLGSNQSLPENPISSMDSVHKFLSLDYFEHLIKNEEIINDKILLIGGEPLIHPNIIKIVKLFRKKGKLVSVRTNARMLSNENFCTLLMKYVDEILVIDAANNETDYEKISKVKGSWIQSRIGIKNWKEKGGKLIYFAPD